VGKIRAKKIFLYFCFTFVAISLFFQNVSGEFLMLLNNLVCVASFDGTTKKNASSDLFLSSRCFCIKNGIFLVVVLFLSTNFHSKNNTDLMLTALEVIYDFKND
jgi:hypothetical protein